MSDLIGEVEKPFDGPRGKCIGFVNWQIWAAYSADPRSVRGVTVPILLRDVAARQVPPGYDGSGSAIAVLLPGFRYYRHGCLEGRVSCSPDEAVQLVQSGAATYPE